LPEVKNFADAVFRLEASRQLPEVLAVVRALREILRTPGLQTVHRAFNQWIKALLLRRATASMMKEVVAVEDIFEELEMLTEHKETWFDDEIEESFLKGQEKGLEQGLEKGLEKGREKGREETLMSVARNMLKCGRPVKEIVEVTGLQPETIQSLMH